MRFLHTSDWHLGRALYGKKRDAEFEAFFDWLLTTIENEQIDVLLVAGDIFDTTTPSHTAQAHYYRFLYQVSQTCCSHVVIIAGNHDSPTFLTAPQALLKHLHVHVVGAMSERIEDEIIVLEKNGEAQAIVCAVPYLRDQDLRRLEAGENLDDKNKKMGLGLMRHYQEVAQQAKRLQQQHQQAGLAALPVIAMGHLFVAGGKTIDGDGVRDLYVGNLVKTGVDIFPAIFDYVALGHLHVPQCVAQQEHIRYSGSPIPMGYGEAGQQKQVVVVDFTQGIRKISTITVPRFQDLVRVVGDLPQIQQQLQQLVQVQSQAWLEVEYTGAERVPHLRQQLEQWVEESTLEILRIKNPLLIQQTLQAQHQAQQLDELSPVEVFERCLAAHQVPQAQHPALWHCYQQILQQIQEDDQHA